MLKRFLQEWVVPPAVLRYWRQRRQPRIQKFWAGAPLPSPPPEQRYFAELGCASLTLTRDDDSRPAGVLDATPVRLPVSGSGGDHAQFAVAVDGWTPEDAITVSAGSVSVRQSSLSARQWLDLRIPLDEQPSHEIVVAATKRAYVTVPRRVRTRAAEPGYPRHVLVLVLDGMTPYLREDASADPSRDPSTPNINRFFEDGYLATNGWSTAEWTLPTTGSFFTGLYTSRHRMWHPTMPTQFPDRPNLATFFQEAGYHTLAFSTANRLTPAYGSHRGFDRFLYHWPYPGHTSRDYDPARWCDEILGHLDTHRHDRTFIYAHFPDTHPSWNVPPLTRFFNLQRRGSSTGHDLDALRGHPAAKEQGRQLNAIRLQELDRLLGGVFDFLERYMPGQHLVVATADHGTPWPALRDRRPADEPYLVDQRTKVEFRMRGPGVTRRRFDGLCSPTIDLMPTLLARSGLASPSDLDGRDLLDPGYRRDVALSESLYGGAYEIAVRDATRTYIEKFPMHATGGRVEGPASYRRCFARGTEDYGSPVDDRCEDLAAAALSHRRAVGMAE